MNANVCNRYIGMFLNIAILETGMKQVLARINSLLENKQRKRRHILTTALGLGVLLLASAGLADSPVRPRSSGNFHKGTMTVPLHRGASTPFEAFLPALPSNCEGEMTLTLTWD